MFYEITTYLLEKLDKYDSAFKKKAQSFKESEEESATLDPNTQIAGEIAGEEPQRQEPETNF